MFMTYIIFVSVSVCLMYRKRVSKHLTLRDCHHSSSPQQVVKPPQPHPLQLCRLSLPLLLRLNNKLELVSCHSMQTPLYTPIYTHAYTVHDDTDTTIAFQNLYNKHKPCRSISQIWMYLHNHWYFQRNLIVNKQLCGYLITQSWWEKVINKISANWKVCS